MLRFVVGPILFSLISCVHSEVEEKHCEPGKKKTLVNLNEQGVAVDGYDVVSYFTDARPTPGKAEFQSIYGHAKYFFASAVHKAHFDKEPQKYVPQYGGYCGYAASKGLVVEVNPEYWTIENERLVLQKGSIPAMLWKRDVPGQMRAADENWPRLVEEKGDCLP